MKDLTASEHGSSPIGYADEDEKQAYVAGFSDGYDEALQMVWHEINVLGGYRPTERNYDQDYVDAIAAALSGIEKHQFPSAKPIAKPPCGAGVIPNPESQ
jgi:hypothetical protein